MQITVSFSEHRNQGLKALINNIFQVRNTFRFDSEFFFAASLPEMTFCACYKLKRKQS